MERRFWWWTVVPQNHQNNRICPSGRAFHQCAEKHQALRPGAEVELEEVRCPFIASLGKETTVFNFMDLGQDFPFFAMK